MEASLKERIGSLNISKNASDTKQQLHAIPKFVHTVELQWLENARNQEN